jgi:hypothetical protein
MQVAILVCWLPHRGRDSPGGTPTAELLVASSTTWPRRVLTRRRCPEGEGPRSMGGPGRVRSSPPTRRDSADNLVSQLDPRPGPVDRG